MARLGPFEATPTLAVAVSGGADSTALGLLARDWVCARGGTAVALIVDHRLRPDSTAEANTVAGRLRSLGILPEILTLHDLSPGGALAERARIRRYQALLDRCRARGWRHLLLGHHAGDQVETVAMRVLRGSRNEGLAGMSALRVSQGVRLLRPLLAAHPSQLRHLLAERGVAWVEDPSNRNPRALRNRLRMGLADRPWQAFLRAIAAAGAARAAEEAAIAGILAERAVVYAEGYARLMPGPLPPGALAQLLAAIAGAAYPPDPDRVAALAAHPGPATLHGARIMPAGRLGPGWLVVREEAAIAAPVPAAQETCWDSRFRLTFSAPPPPSGWIGRLGEDAARFRRRSDLPSAVLRTLPALRIGKTVAAVPHLGYGCTVNDLVMTATFAPPRPLDGPPFLPAIPDLRDAAHRLPSGEDARPGCVLPWTGEPSARVGMQGRASDTIYPGGASGSPNTDNTRCRYRIEDVSKIT